MHAAIAVKLCHRQVKRANRESGRDLVAEAKVTYPGKNLYDVQLPKPGFHNGVSHANSALPRAKSGGC